MYGYGRTAGYMFFLKYILTDALNYGKAPGSHRGAEGDMAMAALPRCSCLTTYNSYCSLGPCTDAVHGAAGHNRWGVAETPLPVKTQGRNLDGSLTFNVYAVCRVAFNPSGETSGLMGAVPRTGLPGRQTLLSASALGARGWRRGRRPEYRQWPTGQRCKVAHGARGASRGGDPRTDQKPTGQTVRVPLAGRPSPELAGNVPRTGEADATFLTQSVSSRSCGPSPLCICSASSSCVSLLRFSLTPSFGALPYSSLSFPAPVSVPRLVSLSRQFLPFYDIRHLGRKNCVLEIGCGEASCVSVSYL